MKFLRGSPISRKVLRVTLVVSLTGLLLMGGALFGFQIYSFRQDFPKAVTADGELIATYSIAPMAFRDAAAAQEILRGLRSKRHISDAQLVLTDGTVLARYGDTGWKPTRIEGLSMEGAFLTYSHRLVFNDEQLGTLHLRTTYQNEMWKLVKLHAAVLAVVLALSILLSAIVSSRMQRLITRPILTLANTAKAIATERDYSLRAKKLEDDEIGQFTDAFNEMLAQIQQRDTALGHSRQKLETLINSIEGVVWEAKPETLKFTFVSAQTERLLGVSADVWLSDRFWTEAVHEDDRDRVRIELNSAVVEQRPFSQEFRLRSNDHGMLWVRSYGNLLVEHGRPLVLRGVLIDVTREKKAAQELAVLQAELVATSRQAGMAEVATGVLHNVGNVLNSVNVSATLICNRLRNSETATLTQVAGLISDHEKDFARFVGEDPKGRLIPGFVCRLAKKLNEEHTHTSSEFALLAKNIEHIKEIVAMQQNYARVAGVMETLSPEELVEDALQINAAGFQRHGVDLARDFHATPKVSVERHKALQILINLFRNAKYAMDETRGVEKRMVIRIARNGNNTVHIEVSDTGVGIPQDNLTKIFSHGFTTKKEGHGFGLHSSSIAAKQMGGSLTAHSAGPGRGATFILELPLAEQSI